MTVPVLKYHDGTAWVEVSTAGPQGPPGPTGPEGPASAGADEVVVDATEPVDPAIELWVDTDDDSGGVPSNIYVGSVAPYPVLAHGGVHQMVTDVSGMAAVSFGFTFAAVPIITFSMLDFAGLDPNLTPIIRTDGAWGPTTTGFTLANLLPSTTITFNYIALGQV